ncbi:hypothetical protein EW145_g3748 [Phellinidium pouzarii]|uniref:t-SNARE coiled-coil homology domain-containing protein n=1 Tax=Phellinidium pouzarii TaxID=167371 RepID=A0A4S4L6A2_9AGAM|nr:hypothetical protein EW145_g3748 [Phellinidium pouzarii]
MSSETDPKTNQLPLELRRLSLLIDERPEKFASGDEDIQEAALIAAKYIFDLTLKVESRAQPHLAELIESMQPTRAPQTRAQARAAAQNGHLQSPSVNHAILTPTPLSGLFVSGMEEDQIWAQLELKSMNMCATLEDVFDAGDVDARGTRDFDEQDEDSEDDSSELDEDAMEGLEGIGPNGQDWEMHDSEEDEDESDKDEGEDSAEEEDLEENITELCDPSSEEENEENDLAALDLAAGPSSRHMPTRKFGRKEHAELDDGFFNLSEFNAEIEEAESVNVSRGSLSKVHDDDDSEDEDVDFFIPHDTGGLGDDKDDDSGEVYYRDFFEPPPKQAPKAKRNLAILPPKGKNSKVQFDDQVKVKTIKSKGKGLSLKSADFWIAQEMDDEDGKNEDFMFNDEDPQGMRNDGEEGLMSDDESELDQGREAIERLKDDLFAEGDDAPKSGLSTYEARMAAIREQIAQLEAENVGEKDWVLKGEVSSRARPQNALLEEDLEFEHLMKAVPVVTDEVVQDLEARIKVRILEGRFDDVVRKRAVDDKPFLPSRVLELQDTKSKESLAQIYENEYMAAQTGGTLDDRDGKLQKEHDEIEKLWESVCSKLDALCNAHFTPKQPKATISTVSNVSAISLESALPTAKATSTILAPEEVFAPVSSDLRVKSEMTPAEKQALRAKERKKRQKQRETLATGVDKFARMKGIKGVKKQKEVALKSMIKTGKGVTVIGKKTITVAQSRFYKAAIFSSLIIYLLTLWPGSSATRTSLLSPPVESVTFGRPPPSSAPPSYRSSSTTYIASRDGDLSDPRAYGNLSVVSYQQNSARYYGNPSYAGGGHGDTGRPIVRQKSDGYGANANYSDSRLDQSYAPQTQYRSRNEYGVTGGVSDVYARGERDLDTDRNALFAGSAPIQEGGNKFMDGPGGSVPQTSGEEEEDVEGIKAQTKFLKQDTVASTRNALRVAREAEEAGRATLLRLGEQSEKIANTERHLDISKGHALRADDNADEIKKLNRSIFIPAITFNKDAKRLAQERKRELRYQEEMAERELTMEDIYISRFRIDEAATSGRSNGRDTDEEGIGGIRRQKTSAVQNLRMEERKRYQFEATESDDEMEDEIDDNLDEILDATKRMKTLGLAMGSELRDQNDRLGRVTGKVDKLGLKVDSSTAKVRLLGEEVENAD